MGRPTGPSQKAVKLLHVTGPYPYGRVSGIHEGIRCAHTALPSSDPPSGALGNLLPSWKGIGIRPQHITEEPLIGNLAEVGFPTAEVEVEVSRRGRVRIFENLYIVS